MSVKALNHVFEYSRADGAAFIVLVVMADWSDQNCRCYPSYSQIAKKARVSRASAVAAVNELVKLGELERETRRHGPDADDDEAPRNVRAQFRNAYRVVIKKREPASALNPSTEEVVHLLDHSAKSQVGRELDHPRKSEVVQPLDGLLLESDRVGGPIRTAEVVQSDDRIKGIDRQVDRQDLKAGSPTPPDPEPAENNLNVITKIAHESIDLCGADDLPEVVKARCASLRIAYDSGVVRKAIESAQWQRAHRRQAGA